MSARIRLFVLIATVLVSASLAAPSPAEDVVIEPIPRDWEETCFETFYEYNVEVATFMTPYKRDLCWYQGALLVTVTMTRWENSIFRNDPPTTVTATAECPASSDCEFRVSMPHPNPERAWYYFDWTFKGLDPTPSGRSWTAKKWESLWCESYLIFAKCGAFGEYWVVRIPDA